MRLPGWFSTLAVSVLLAVAPLGAAWAAALRVVATDAHGVTLQLDADSLAVSAPDASGRSRASIPGLGAESEPGRPDLPIASTLIAMPLGARATVTVTPGPMRTLPGVHLMIAGKPGFQPGPPSRNGRTDWVPVRVPVPAIADGPWPRAAAELGEPFTLRRMRLVALRVHPVRYDEGAASLTLARTLTVRVEFSGGAAAGAMGATEDRHWDSVLEQSVANFSQARAWRAPRVPVTTPGLEIVRRAPSRLTVRPGLRPGAGALGAAAAFDEDQPEVRVTVDTTGVYALPFTQLAANGFPAGIAVNAVSVHRHEFVQGGNPPYVTVELPIEVDDANANGVFDAGDRIVVFVQNWAERSRASIAQRNWGDAEVVYATYLVGRPGLRIPQRSGTIGAPLAPLASYRTTDHYEKTTFYVNAFYPGFPPFTPAESDTNTDQFLWTGIGLFDRSDPSFSDVFPFATNDLDPTRPVAVSVQWIGNQEVQHANWAEVKNASNQYRTVVDSLGFFGRRTATGGSTLPPGAVSNGTRNALRIWGQNVNPPSPVVTDGLNWFEVRYPRYFRALAGMLECNSDSVSGAYEIMATRFASRAIRVYDVTDSIAGPVRLALDDSLLSSTAPYSVRFQDQSPDGSIRRYAVFDVPKALPASKFAAVTRRHLYAQSPPDFVLIAPEQLLAPAQRLAAAREAQGLHTLLCPLESLNDEWNGGRKSSYTIRRFLQYADTTWGARFVLLFGDGSEDPLNKTGTAGPDLVPTQKVAGPVGIPDGQTGATVYEAVPSDPWYVWCLDCPEPEGPRLWDMFIGRLPVSSVDQANGVVDKLLAYDQVTADQIWRRRMLLVADDQYSTESFFGGGGGGPLYCKKTYEKPFIDITNVAKYTVVTEGGLAESDVEVFDLAQYLANEPTYYDPNQSPPDTCRQSWSDTQDHCHLTVTPQMFARLNDGRLWWNFQGHANPYVLTHENLYVNSNFNDDLQLFANTGKPFLFTAFSCHPNAFGTTVEGRGDVGPALGEEMVDLPGGGAIASWASDAYEVLPFDVTDHLNVHFARAMFADPPRDPYLGQGGARTILGEVIGLTIMRNAPATGGLEAEVGTTYHLLGDPTTRMSIGAPQEIVTANQLPVTSGDPVRLRTRGDSLDVEADVVSTVRLVAIDLIRTRDGSTTTLPASAYTLTPAFPDTSDASKGGKRFHLSFTTTLAADSYVFTIRATDRYGLVRNFDVTLPFQTVLRADNAPVGNGGAVAPNAALTLTVLSPAPLTLPGELTVKLNNAPITYTWVPANGDTTGREWTLTIAHENFADGSYHLDVQTSGGGTTTQTFIVEPGSSKVGIRDAFAFPNPFDESGTSFSFRLAGVAPADLQIRVYTVTGRLVYKRIEHGLMPGYQQLAWNGQDAEGQPLANGIYVYKLLAQSGSTHDEFTGRLVKLRKPRHFNVDTGATGP